MKPVPLSALCFVFLSLDGTASCFTVHCRMRGTDVWLQLKIATGLDPPETDLTFRNMEKSNNRKETGWSFILKILNFKAMQAMQVKQLQFMVNHCLTLNVICTHEDMIICCLINNH